jgi:hypothetical protein
LQGDLRELWGAESLKWAMECASRHLACRSHQVYRSLRPAVSSDTCVSLLRCLHKCFTNPTPPVLAFVMEVLLTLQVRPPGNSRNIACTPLTLSCFTSALPRGMWVTTSCLAGKQGRVPLGTQGFPFAK